MTVPPGLVGKAYVPIFAAIGGVLAWAVCSYLFGWIGFLVSAGFLLMLWIRFGIGDNTQG